MKKTPLIHIFVLTVFLANTFGPLPIAQAQDFRLPAPGVMVQLSSEFNPPILKGIKVHPDNPFRFDFILDKGDFAGNGRDRFLQNESTKLIKYFLASLTIPEKDLWVNLSPYEKDRIIPQSFGLTEMGRDLLAEDYMLKQITASLIYPEGETGKKFWKRIYEEAAKKFGTTNIPVNTFNKVWIVPEKAVVYENTKAGTAYVVESKLKVMLEEDYLSLQKHMNNDSLLTSNILRAIVIPELTKEINEGKNFAQLRQVYNSLILATWYKKKIKDSILAQVYADKRKVAGVGYKNFPVEAIYQRYLQAFKKGVYNYIKEDVDPLTQEIVPRKYFSGGVDFAMSGDTTMKGIDRVMDVTDAPSALQRILNFDPRRLFDVQGTFEASRSIKDQAMTEDTVVNQLVPITDKESRFPMGYLITTPGGRLDISWSVDFRLPEAMKMDFFSNGQSIGYVQFYSEGSRWASATNINYVFVEPQFRNSNYAAVMISAALKWLRRLSAVEDEPLSVGAYLQNPLLFKILQDNGFVERWPGFLTPEYSNNRQEVIISKDKKTNKVLMYASSDKGRESLRQTIADPDKPDWKIFEVVDHPIDGEKCIIGQAYNWADYKKADEQYKKVISQIRFSASSDKDLKGDDAAMVGMLGRAIEDFLERVNSLYKEGNVLLDYASEEEKNLILSYLGKMKGMLLLKDTGFIEKKKYIVEIKPDNLEEIISPVWQEKYKHKVGAYIAAAAMKLDRKTASKMAVILGLPSTYAMSRINELVSAQKKSFENIDALTSLYGRKGGERSFRGLIQMLIRQGDKKHGWAIVICKMDIDFFKTINDVFGYTQQGDLVLARVAEILKKNIRENGGDIVFRLGGDEFVVAMSIYNNDTGRIVPRLKELIKAIRMGEYGGLDRKKWVIDRLLEAEKNKKNQADRIKIYESLLLQLFLQNKDRYTSIGELQEELPDLPTAIKAAKAAEGEKINGHTYTFKRWVITPSIGVWKAKKSASTQGEYKKISDAWGQWFLDKALQKSEDNLNKAKNHGRDGFVMTTGDIGPDLARFDEFQETDLQGKKGSANPAMNVQPEKGGIDLTPANINLQIQNAGEGIKFHLDPAMLKQLQNAPGFVPVIINVQPLNDLKSFLGIVNQT